MEKKGTSPQLKPKEIIFKPVTEGLGFHPFSDGLPYAPLSKTGSGAVAAGPSRFVKKIESPMNSLPTLPYPQSSPIQARNLTLPKRPLVSDYAKREINKNTSPIASLEVKKESNFNFAYLLKRTFAYALDTFFHSMIFISILGTIIWTQNFKWEIFLNSNVLVTGSIFFGFFHWLLMITQEILFKTSLGKNIFNLYFEGNHFNIFVRALLFPLNFPLCGLGLFISLIDSQKRCWHDRISNVQPFEKS